MKTKLASFVIASLLFALPCAANSLTHKVALVNFKTCVEKSKLGKEEQANFDRMKKQMEDVLTEKEKFLKEIAKKLGPLFLF